MTLIQTVRGLEDMKLYEVSRGDWHRAQGEEVETLHRTWKLSLTCALPNTMAKLGDWTSVDRIDTLDRSISQLL